MQLNWCWLALMASVFFTLAALQACRLLTTIAALGGPDNDRTALLALRAAVEQGGFGASRLQDWGAAEGFPCSPGAEWAHITCSDSRIIRLELAEMEIGGSLPLELRELDALRVLNLEGNRFWGELPAGWGEPPYFPSLVELRLAGNALNGSLPNRAWNAKSAWPSLRRLSLARNSFHGGLPDGWAGSERAFASLKRLDLSGNILGYSDAGATQLLPDQPDWCLAGDPPESTGWCATRPTGTAFASLTHLDLSSNGLAGQLPQQWPAMFPRLQTLRLHGNNLTAQPAAAARPSALPLVWTQQDSPSCFPKLQELVLYPGNEFFCSLPEDGGGILDVNLNNTYLVTDDHGDYLDTDNPKTCPPPPEDNPPSLTALWVDPATGAAMLSWQQVVGEAYVFGYRILLEIGSSESDDWEAVSLAVQPRTYLDETRPKLSPGLHRSEGGEYTLDLGYQGPSGLYRVHVTAFNVDAQQSSRSVLEAELQFSA